MAEQLLNLVQTTCDGAYTAGSGSLDVIDASGITATCTVGVYDQSTFACKALLTVSAVVSNTLTVASEGLDTNAASGDLVRVVQSARSLAALVTQMSQSGSFASLPSPTGQIPGTIYRQTDGPYEFRGTGSAWVAFVPGFGQVTMPVDADFSWINQGGATTITTNGGVTIQDTGAAGTNLHLRVKTAPATPYTLDFGFRTTLSTNASIEAGAVWRQSSDGKLVAMRWIANALNFNLSKWTSPTVFSADYLATTTYKPDMMRGLIWVRLADDGANRIVSISSDGYNWTLFFSVGRTDFMTADQVGFYIRADAGTSVNSMQLIALNQG